MKANHTPGPWYVSRHPSLSENGDSIHCEADGSIVCEGLNWSDCAQANARLIAAAPDLLEALCLMSSDFAIFRRIALENGIAGTLGANSIEKAQAAISKAKGESHDS